MKEKKKCLPLHYRGGFSDRNNIDKLNTEMQITQFSERTRVIFINKLQEILNKITYNVSMYSGEDLFKNLFDYICIEVYNLEMDVNCHFPKKFIDSYYDYDSFSPFLSQKTLFYDIVENTIRNDSYDKVLTIIEAILLWTKQNIIYRMPQYEFLEDGQAKETEFDEIKIFNKIFEREFVGYRFVGNIITPITDEIEVSEIKNGLEVEFNGCRSHIQKALGFLSDRENPDYKNSIKESISAVESICTIIINEPNKTLGEAIKAFEKKGLKIHPSLQKAFLALYGYASNQGGIRHSENLFESNVTFEEAKYMLVSCCAFVNYLIAEYGKINGESK